MLLADVNALIATLKPDHRLAGIDPGRKLIGVAIADVGHRFASPAKTLSRDKLKINGGQLGAFAQAEKIGGFVVGCPYDEDGKLGPAGQAARDWAKALSSMLNIPVCLWDESLTTLEVESFMTETADLSRGKRLKTKDRAAAALILQQALDDAERKRLMVQSTVSTAAATSMA